MKKRVAFWNSKTISFVSGMAFLLVICMIFISIYYMNICIEDESRSQNNRYELSKLGESLAEASDYLTDEARKYAITGDITYFYNYWYEVARERTRDRVIEELTSYHPPQQERELLEEAKEFSDQLIITETYSMKLILLSQNKTEKDFKEEGEITEYIRNVLECEIPAKYDDLTSEEMKQEAVHILFDDNYMNSKNRIMSPTDEFQDIMNERLNKEVASSVQGRKHALILQNICILIAVVIMGVILLVFQYFYISPLKNYTRQLQGGESDKGELRSSRIRIQPGGAYELREFGRIFNELSWLLFQEVEKSSRAENNMRIAKEEAVKANRAKSDFLAHMSHELRTPLNAIMGYVYLLNETSLNHTQQRYCDNIQSSSDGLMSLISDVLDFSKIESGNMVVEEMPFSPMNLIQEVYQMMENTAGQKGICLKLDIRSDLPAVVIGDSLKLRQVLINLVGNGIKFTQKGAVTIRVETAEMGENPVHINFAVSDTGIGIDTLMQEAIFEPFVQSEAGTTRKYGGTGLGLAISKRIVEQCSKGEETLHLESEVGKGSVFSFSLPFVPGSKSQLINENPNQEYMLDSDKIVLLVDDNEMNIDVESEIIAGFGVNVVTASSGKEAIAYVKEHRVDFIFLDIRMPEMDGYETSCKIRSLENGRQVPIIALSADAVEGVREKVISFGMNDYITKPLKPIVLRQIMQKYFQLSQEEQPVVPIGNGIYFQAEECLANLNQNERLLVKLCNRFLKGQCNALDFIKQHLADQNIGNVLSMLHDLKGICGNLCLGPLYETVLEFEKNLQCQKEVDYEYLKKIFDATILEVTEYVNGKKRYYEENTGKETYDQIYERFLYLCRQNDVLAIDLFQSQAMSFEQNLPKKIFRQLEEAVLKYDFEAVLQILEAE